MASGKSGNLKILIDSDVTFDFISGRLPFYNEALKIFTFAENNLISLYTLPHLMINVWQVRGHMGIGSIEMNKSISRLLNLVKILDEHSASFIKAVQAKRIDLEDSMVIECAINSNMDAIITRNIKHYKLSPIEVFTPGGFLAKMAY